jgi:hypothetical protein
MPASQSGVYNVQEWTDLGTPLVGGRLYTLVYGTTTKKTAYTDAAGTIPQTYTSDGVGGEYIALDARGELPAPLYLTPGSYDLLLKTAAGATVWTRRADPTFTSADVGNLSGVTVADYAALRTALDATTATSFVVTGADGSGAPDESIAGQYTRGQGAAPAESLPRIVVSSGGAWAQLMSGAFKGTSTGEVATNVSAYLNLEVKGLKRSFGLSGDFGEDATAKINQAIQSGKVIEVEEGTFKIIPATSKTDEAGTNMAGLVMRSNMRMYGQAGPASILKIGNNVSTDAAPLRHSMFFSNEYLNNIHLEGMTLDMNGANNLISPNRGSLSFNRFTNAAVIFSGTPGGVAAGADHVRLLGLRMKNFAGVSAVLSQQSNTTGITLSKDWVIAHGSVYNVGIDTDDHSSFFLWGTDMHVFDMDFDNPAMFNNTTKTGGVVAIEIHGSRQTIAENRIKNYTQAVWCSMNLTEALAEKFIIANNTAKVSSCFTDIYSNNLMAFINPASSRPHQIEIDGNIIDITDDAVNEQVKSFFRFNARNQPMTVDVKNNICRSYTGTAKETVLAQLVVGTDQENTLDQINICNNTASGITNGLLVFFGGDGAATAVRRNLGRVTFRDNDLGYLVASTVQGYPASDIHLYGTATGIIESLTVSGLQQPTPITTDSAVGGRAAVYGKAIITSLIPVTWSGVTIGNGALTKKIAIDTDTGYADVHVTCAAGSTTTFSGNVAPSFTGLTANSTGTASVTHLKTGVGESVPAVIFNTATGISLYSPTGTAFDSSRTTDGQSYIAVQARFPCAKADV